MYNTAGIDAIASITELRSKTSDLIEYVRNEQKGVLVQKNNEPHAVLLDWTTYRRLAGEPAAEGDRPPRQRARSSAAKGEEPASNG